jgi:hypothetical protein
VIFKIKKKIVELKLNTENQILEIFNSSIISNTNPKIKDHKKKLKIQNKNKNRSISFPFQFYPNSTL